jgi:hypothetical protein
MHLYLKNQSPNKFGSKDIAQVKVFQNEVKIQDQSHKFKIKVTRSKVLEQKKGLFIMHLYLRYQSSSTYGSKDIAQVKVFQN